ncbi:MAG: DUF1801 domain-containing protein [Pseudomonadota bacterium]
MSIDDIAHPGVRDAFAAFPPGAQPGLLRLRHLILDTAALRPEVGRIEETLRWGQPSYLTPETKSGTTLRLGVPRTGGFALYAHCQTSVIAEAQEMFPGTFMVEGTRALLFDDPEALPEEPLRIVIGRALTYHLKEVARA